MFLTVKVSPNGKVNKIITASDGTLQVKLKAPAIDGKANEALIAYLSALLNLSKSSITIISGFTSRFKRLEIAGDVEVITAGLTIAAIKK